MNRHHFHPLPLFDALFGLRVPQLAVYEHLALLV